MANVSVVIATRNRCQLLKRAVTSAMWAGKEVEVVVVDDASTDETARIREFLANHVYVRLNRRHGLAAARNVGIRASSADFIAFLDDDDLRLRGSLDRQLHLISQHKEIGMVYGQALLGDADCLSTGKAYPLDCPEGDIFWNLLEANFIPCPTVLFRRSCLDRIGFMNDQMMRATDWDLWLRIAAVYPVRALRLPVAIYRQSDSQSDQLTSDASTFVRAVRRIHRDSWMKLPRAAAASKSCRDRATAKFSAAMAGHLLGETKRALERKQYLAAARSLNTAVTTLPLTSARAAFAILGRRCLGLSNSSRAL